MRIAFSVLAILSLSVTLMAANPLLGTWKLNVAKSKLQCSDNIVSETMKITEAGPNSFRSTFDIVLKSGEPDHLQDPVRYLDGKEHAGTWTGWYQ